MFINLVDRKWEKCRSEKEVGPVLNKKSLIWEYCVEAKHMIGPMQPIIVLPKGETPKPPPIPNNSFEYIRFIPAPMPQFPSQPAPVFTNKRKKIDEEESKESVKLDDGSNKIEGLLDDMTISNSNGDMM